MLYCDLIIYNDHMIGLSCYLLQLRVVIVSAILFRHKFCSHQIQDLIICFGRTADDYWCLYLYICSNFLKNKTSFTQNCIIENQI